jgi:hypothetical protein
MPTRALLVAHQDLVGKWAGVPILKCYKSWCGFRLEVVCRICEQTPARRDTRRLLKDRGIVCRMLSGVRLRPWSRQQRRRRTGDRFQFRLPARVSGPERQLASKNQFNGASVVALRIRPAASAAQAGGRHAKLVCACWPPRLWHRTSTDPAPNANSERHGG